mmetsp:Transcript_28621/g.32061  ORF Transcript_28621/g.32061 Transcript_28621/m.32061 type:complete len:91 (+) Transcript_28621:158-430(+)
MNDTRYKSPKYELLTLPSQVAAVGPCSDATKKPVVRKIDHPPREVLKRDVFNVLVVACYAVGRDKLVEVAAMTFSQTIVGFYYYATALES